MVGIVSYGTYIPKSRIRVADIARAWGKDPNEVTRSLGVEEKAAPSIDEDAVTIAIESARQAFADQQGTYTPSDIGALYVGSESHPYAVNPTSTIVGEFLGVGNDYFAVDLEFACKAATAGMQAIAGLLESRAIRLGLAIGADTAQSKPHDVLEYTSAAAGAAYLLGRDEVVARLLAYASYSSDTPDFWRRDGIRYPSHAGRFTGEPAYFAHVAGASLALMKKARCKPEDVDYCVFHMPNGKFPREAARRLGFSEKQLVPSLTITKLGNPYSASMLVGLAAVLDIAKPNARIFAVSYGSGAGSDAFLFKTTEALTQVQNAKRKMQNAVRDQIESKTYIDYVQYLKQTRKI